jgi:hypothetical protein
MPVFRREEHCWSYKLSAVCSSREDCARCYTRGISGCVVDEAFPAVEAWGAVTGLGSMDYARLKEISLDLPEDSCMSQIAG